MGISRKLGQIEDSLGAPALPVFSYSLLRVSLLSSTSSYIFFFNLLSENLFQPHQSLSYPAILESKLDSVPELSSVTSSTPAPTEAAPESAAPAAPSTAPAAPPPPPLEAPAPGGEEEEPAPEVKVRTVSEDPRYTKYFKMLKMGVPLQVSDSSKAVKFLQIHTILARLSRTRWHLRRAWTVRSWTTLTLLWRIRETGSRAWGPLSHNIYQPK